MKRSAGILLFRSRAGGPEVLLVHPGGPFWSRKDLGAWSIPKGEHGPEEEPLAAALRELEEETGLRPRGEPVPLGSVRQARGKEVRAWAAEGDADPAAIRSNTFALEWPPGSGKTAEFPEVDRAGWFPFEVARQKILKAQLPLLEELERLLRPSST